VGWRKGKQSQNDNHKVTQANLEMITGSTNFRTRPQLPYTLNLVGRLGVTVISPVWQASIEEEICFVLSHISQCCNQVPSQDTAGLKIEILWKTEN
jgi:hypothetical protein